MNERFADILAGSILSGFRVTAGSDSTKVSLILSGDTQSVLVTWTGVRVVEDTDVIDTIDLIPNSTATDRLDSIYAYYTHGAPDATVAYIVLLGNADGTPAAEPSRSTYTYIGQVRVPANGGVITAGDYTSKSHGIDAMEFAKGGTVHGSLHLDGALSTDDAATTRTNLQVYSKTETDTNISNAIKQFEFIQSTAATTWTVTHNLNRYPSVTILDGSNNAVSANLSYPDANTVTITFASAFAGTAYLY